jgi:DNA polymerase-3 subunit delta
MVEIERDTLSTVPDEMASLPLTGGRRVVRVRDAGETAAGVVQKVLASKAAGFLVLESPGLSARGKLRGLVERAPDGAVIGCYPQDGAALGGTIRKMLGAAGVSADSDALEWLTTQLGADRGVTQSEIEKLALFAGEGGRVDMEAARTCVGDLAGLSIDDALFAATAGEVPATDRALELAMAEGANAVGVLRAAILHLQRLHRARLAVDSGLSAGEAAKAARPPVFFRREPAFTQALRLWSAPALEAAAGRVWENERACKRTGAPAEAICRSSVLGLAQRAAAARRQ